MTNEEFLQKLEREVRALQVSGHEKSRQARRLSQKSYSLFHNPLLLRALYHGGAGYGNTV